jgi:hypothetical protein
MRSLSDAYGLLRFARGVKTLLREPISVETAKAFVQDRMARRTELFLGMLERAVFQNPRSPYGRLLREAGCELGDVRWLVAQEGLEGALYRLREAGVYVTYEEFKGRATAARGGRAFSFRDSDFDNPLTQRHFWSNSGGTGGRPTRVPMNLEHIEQSAPHWALWFAAHGWIGQPLVFWTPFYAAVVNRQLMCAKFGSRFVRWLADGHSGSVRDRFVSTCVHRLVRRAAAFPRPEPCVPGDAAKVGEILHGMASEGRGLCVVTSPSAAVRASVAAQERGLRLEGVSFLLGAEPLTPARKGTIEACGAKAVPTYGFSEGGSLGSQCPNAQVADDVHVSLDAFAVIQRPREAGNGDLGEALLLTSLRPACPKIMLNTEIGDSAVLEARRCGCLFDELGYFQHLHTIRSFQKLTAEGATILTADLYPLLETVLPGKFGGAPGDYQLIEEQNRSGLTRYCLVVSPRVGAVEAERLMQGFLEELGKLRDPYRLMIQMWLQARVLHVRREHPLATSRGKVLPFQVRRAEERE